MDRLGERFQTALAERGAGRQTEAVTMELSASAAKCPGATDNIRKARRSTGLRGVVSITRRFKMCPVRLSLRVFCSKANRANTTPMTSCSWQSWVGEEIACSKDARTPAIDMPRRLAPHETGRRHPP